MMDSYADQLLVSIPSFCIVAAVLGAFSLRLSGSSAVKTLFLAKLTVFGAAASSIMVLNIFIRSFIEDKFSLLAVARFSSSRLPFIYKLGAVWAGPPGSLLLWSVAAVVLFALWLATLKTDGSAFNATAMIVGASVCLGLSLIVLLVARPFACSSTAVTEGAGPGPLPESVWMLIHPPAFILAYSTFMIPFIVVVASVFGGGTGTGELYAQLRRWLLVGVGFLCLGIVSGVRWAYIELDWSGYWVWDPIQNLSLLPLLAAIAALHSINAMQLCDKFRRWTLALAPIPFVLCLFLAFVGSSNILKSVHTFGRSEVSSSLLSFTCVCLFLWLFCLVQAVRTVSVVRVRPGIFRLDRSKILFWSNIGFVVTAAAIGLATFMSAILKVVTNSTTIHIPAMSFYGEVISVAGIALIFLIGFYGLVDLRQRRGSNRLPILICCAPGILCFGIAYRLANRTLLLSLACACGVFSIIAVLIRFFVALKNREKIGGCICHLGVVLVLISAGLSGADRSVQTSLDEGDTLPFGGWEFVYDSFEKKITNDVEQAGPRIFLTKGSRHAELWPHRKSYPGRPQVPVRSKAAVDTGLFADVSVSFEELTPDGKATITVKIRPFMFWLWFGAVLVISGSVLAAFEGRSRLLPMGLHGESAYG
ncbi:MAG: cytochrome c biogenesis protein CcsA [Sedimentisphaerales bacterium]|nr:cytochrome c biogenesis protein CcsA [Sedimentisphaerales bacterium]